MSMERVWKDKRDSVSNSSFCSPVELNEGAERGPENQEKKWEKMESRKRSESVQGVKYGQEVR